MALSRTNWVNPLHGDEQVHTEKWAKSGITSISKWFTRSNLIKSNCRDEAGVILINQGNQPFTVERAMRVARTMIAPYPRVAWNLTENLDRSTRGGGGFGSTGTETRTESQGPK